MAKAEAKIPWVPSREVVARVARHLGCTPKDAELRIVDKAKAGLIKARGVTEGRPASLLQAAWHGATDLVGTTMRPPGALCEITNLELCFIDLIAAGLLPGPAERARWSAEEAVAYLVKGVPLPWKEWQGAGATASEIEWVEMDLGRAIREGVPAWGWHPLERRRKRIPFDDFRDEMIEKKALPVSATRLPKVVVCIDGKVGTSPPSRIAEYVGPLWSSIEVDPAKLRQARPRPAEPASPVEAKDWLRRACKAHPQQPGEKTGEYATRLEELMPQSEAGVKKPWEKKTIIRRIQEVRKAEAAAQKGRRPTGDR